VTGRAGQVAGWVTGRAGQVAGGVTGRAGQVAGWVAGARLAATCQEAGRDGQSMECT
jgi:hypothetical protein